jgi:hypothetical protein
MFYQRLGMEGTQRIIAECLTRYEKDGNMFALKLALDGNVQLAEMLRNMKQHYGSVEEALRKSVMIMGHKKYEPETTISVCP